MQSQRRTNSRLSARSSTSSPVRRTHAPKPMRGPATPQLATPRSPHSPRPACTAKPQRRAVHTKPCRAGNQRSAERPGDSAYGRLLSRSSVPPVYTFAAPPARMRTALLGVHGERSLYTHGLVPVAIRDTIALRSTPLGLPDAAARGRCYSFDSYS